MRQTLPSGTPVEVSRPDGATADSFGLVVLPDIAGLRPLFEDLVARLSVEQGWVVAAPEPFPGRESMTLEERFAAIPGLRDDDVVGDALAAADLTGAARVGLIGFCMGGMFAFKSAGAGRFSSVVSFYGMIRIPEAWRGPELTEPLGELRRPGASPVLAIIGGRDPYTPPEDVAELETISSVEVVRYPEAEHGFVHDPSRPSHRPQDAADAWRRALSHLGG